MNPFSFLTGLSEEVDVYHDWIDACEKVNKADAAGHPNKRRRVDSEDARADDRDDDDE